MFQALLSAHGSLLAILDFSELEEHHHVVFCALCLFVRISGIGVRVHQSNMTSPFTFAKTLFLKKVTFRGPR